MGKDPGKALARLEDYDARKFNVLHPQMLVHEGGDIVSPLLAEAVSVVQVSSDPDAGDIYHDPRYAQQGKKGAPTAQLLSRIASAAGIQWDTTESRPIGRQVDPESGHIYVAYQAVARIRQPNGEWHTESAVADIDTQVAEEEFKETYLRKIERGWNKDRSSGRVKFTEADVPEMVRREVLQLKKFALRHAETKAKNRCLRRLLGLKQTYTVQELQRPFVVPRLLYRPDAAHALEEGRRSATELYGDAPALPSGSTEQSPPDGAGGEEEAPTTDHDGRKTTPAPPEESEEGATAPKAAGRSRQGEAPSDDFPPEPKDDPMDEEDGSPHKGERYSRIAEIDPGYLRGVAAGHRLKKRRELAQQWLDYTLGEQGTLT